MINYRNLLIFARLPPLFMLALDSLKCVKVWGFCGSVHRALFFSFQERGTQWTFPRKCRSCHISIRPLGVERSRYQLDTDHSEHWWEASNAIKRKCVANFTVSNLHHFMHPSTHPSIFSCASFTIMGPVLFRKQTVTGCCQMINFVGLLCNSDSSSYRSPLCCKLSKDHERIFDHRKPRNSRQSIWAFCPLTPTEETPFFLFLLPLSFLPALVFWFLPLLIFISSPFSSSSSWYSPSASPYHSPLYFHFPSSQEEVKKKIRSAFCPEGVADGNPCIDYVKHIIFPKLGSFFVPREARNGGDKYVDEEWEKRKWQTVRQQRINPWW